MLVRKHGASSAMRHPSHKRLGEAGVAVKSLLQCCRALGLFPASAVRCRFMCCNTLCPQLPPGGTSIFLTDLQAVPQLLRHPQPWGHHLSEAPPAPLPHLHLPPQEYFAISTSLGKLLQNPPYQQGAHASISGEDQGCEAGRGKNTQSLRCCKV